MSTKGFISFIADGETKDAYNHWASGPSDLGIKVLSWLRSAAAQPVVLREAIAGLRIVSDDDRPPTPEEASRFWQYGDPGAGDPAREWYALLRGTQGDPAVILECGYVVYEDDPFGWIYTINADMQAFSVSHDDGNSVTWPWTDLPTNDQLVGATDGMDPDVG